MYWKAFTSTSLDTTIAARFGKYTYVINVDNSNPHEYIIVPTNFSVHNEEEVILFPFFYFECLSV
jgi:hypothetical protein